MAKKDEPKDINDAALKDVSGGITLDNGIKRTSRITLDNGIKNRVSADIDDAVDRPGLSKTGVVFEPNDEP